MRTTHTFAELEISKAAFDEIAALLKNAGYDHAFVDDAIDMHGIGLTAAPAVTDSTFADALDDSEIRIWINACNHEPARQALRQLLAYRIRGVSTPLLSPTVAGDVARIRQRVDGGTLDLRDVGVLLNGNFDQDLPSRILDAALAGASAKSPEVAER